MTDVIFVKTRYQDIGYASYSDYFRLAELSGYPIIYVDEIPREGVKDKTYIVSPANGEWVNGIKSDGRVIHYNLEWNVDGEHNTPPGVAETWTIDASYAKSIGAKYVPIGSHPDLRLDKLDYKPQYAACFLSYMVHRRQHIANQLGDLALAPHDNLWGARRHEVLSQTRALIHVHQHAHIRGIACLRWAIAAAYSLPVISETIDDWGIFGHSHMLVSDYGNLPTFIRMWLGRNEANILVDTGRALNGLLCRDKTFRKLVEANV